MVPSAEILAEASRLKAIFEGLGAAPFDADILLPADVLLDLYGEDLRARAYVTSDPLKGELMLRPDFTVPLVKAHMESGAAPASYVYSGIVFRKQDTDDTRATEFIQVGYEVFDGSNPVDTDADVFAAIAGALRGAPVRAATGDIGLLIAAVRALRTTEARKAALMRHLWRPGRFRKLMDRYCGRASMPKTRAALLASPDPFAGAGTDVGLRSRAEIEDRISALKADAETPPISDDERALIDRILSLQDTMPNVLSALRDIAVDLPGIAAAVDVVAARVDALASKGVDVESLPFEGSFGRTSMEYYDGFVFGFYPHSGGHPVATGGRYDALTSHLGGGASAPAVGGVIRPDLVLQLREAI